MVHVFGGCGYSGEKSPGLSVVSNLPLFQRDVSGQSVLVDMYENFASTEAARRFLDNFPRAVRVRGIAFH
jgi:hypothetical protein